MIVYAVLTVGYKIYLSQSTGETYYPDYITNITAQQSASLLQSVGYQAEVIPHNREASMKLIVNKKYVARVVEGCNSVSVIILFLSFIVAFAGGFRKTALYILAGSVLIYSVNLIRIVVLSIGLYHYPWRREILHTVIFPLIIYGMVFLLWMFWVNRYTKMHQTNV